MRGERNQQLRIIPSAERIELLARILHETGCKVWGNLTEEEREGYRCQAQELFALFTATVQLAEVTERYDRKGLREVKQTRKRNRS